MNVRLPDGTVVKNVPEGTTQSDLMARVAKMREPPAPKADTAEQIAGNPLTRFALGAASLPLGIAQLATNTGLTPETGKMVNEHLAQLEAMKNKGMEASGNVGIDWAGLAGTIMSPVGLGAVKALPAATTVLGKLGQGTAMGAGFGAATPVTNGGQDFGTEKASQIGIGGFTGGLVSGGVQTAKGLAGIIGSAVESATGKGRAAILDRFQRELAGDKRPEIIAALQKVRELVPGSKPTAGQVISDIPESTALAAHQKAIAKTPVISGAFETRADTQEAARKAALETISKTPKDLELAVLGRENIARFNYNSAFNTAIKADPVLAKMAQNPYFKDALPDAIKLAEANKISTKEDLTKFLHFVKLSLDKQVARTGDTALSNTEKHAVENIREKLISWMGQKNPLYDVARVQHRSLSAPIDQMEVGKYLSDKLASPVLGTERAASFGQALRDAPGTIKRSTGVSMYDKLGQVLTPAQEQSAIGVGADLSRNAQYLQRAAGTNLTGTANVATTMQPQLPNLLSRPAMILNAVMKHLGSNAEDKINKLAGERYLDPKKLAEALKDVPVTQRGSVIDALMLVRNTGLLGIAPTMAAQGILSQPQPALLNPQR